MEIKKLQEIVTNYNPIDNVQSIGGDDRYASLLAVEQILKNKQDELMKKIDEFEKYMSKLLKKDCRIEFESNSPTSARGFQSGINNIFLVFRDSIFHKNDSKIKLTSYFNKNERLDYYKNGVWSFDNGDKKNRYQKIIENDPVVDEFINYYFNWYRNFYDRNRLKTDAGLYLDIFQDEIDGLNIVLSDRELLMLSVVRGDRKSFNFSRFLYETKEFPYGNLKFNFYYHKDVMNDTRIVNYRNDECKSFLNESQIANIYSTIKVDISSFSKELQEEIKKYESYYKLKLHEQTDKEKNELVRVQTERVLEAYKELKKVADLLVNLKTEVNLKKIRLEDIESVFFKNDGKLNDKGYIEIDDMFRNNMLLRLLDLKDIDLTNVDIRNMDFSGTNIHINPQTIYNKDMTNVNASGLKFSPFSDSFDGVILDETIIDDWEAMIDLDMVGSYNDQTQIPESNNKENSR